MNPKWTDGETRADRIIERELYIVSDSMKHARNNIEQ
jgi:hypothetical protein